MTAKANRISIDRSKEIYERMLRTMVKHTAGRSRKHAAKGNRIPHSNRVGLMATTGILKHDVGIFRNGFYSSKHYVEEVEAAATKIITTNVQLMHQFIMKAAVGKLSWDFITPLIVMTSAMTMAAVETLKLAERSDVIVCSGESCLGLRNREINISNLRMDLGISTNSK